VIEDKCSGSYPTIATIFWDKSKMTLQVILAPVGVPGLYKIACVRKPPCAQTHWKVSRKPKNRPNQNHDNINRGTGWIWLERLTINQYATYSSTGKVAMKGAKKVICTIITILVTFLFLFKQNKMSRDCFQRTRNQVFVSHNIVSDNVQTGVISNHSHQYWLLRWKNWLCSSSTATNLQPMTMVVLG